MQSLILKNFNDRSLAPYFLITTEKLILDQGVVPTATFPQLFQREREKDLYITRTRL